MPNPIISVFSDIPQSSETSAGSSAAQNTQRYKEIEQIAKYNRDNNTNFYTLAQIQEHQKKLQELERAKTVASNPDPEDVRDAYISALNPQTTKDVDKIRKWDKDAATTNAIGLAAVGTIPEMATFGVVPGLARYGLGLITSHYGSQAGTAAGGWLDDKLGTKVFSPALGFVGGLAGYGMGAGMATGIGRIPLWKTYKPLSTNAPQLTGHFGQVKYYGPTMGKTTAAKSNPKLVDFDDIIRQPSRSILDRFGFKNKAEMYNSGNQEAIKAYEDMLVKSLRDWRANPENSNLTLVASPTAIANPTKTGFYFDNVPSIPSRSVFIARNVGRGGTPEASAMWYDSLMEKNPNLKIDNRFVSEIEKQAYIAPNTGYKSIFMEEPIMSSSKRNPLFEHSIRMHEDSENGVFSEYNVQNFLNAKNKANYLDRTYDGRYTVTAYDSFNRRNAGGDQRAAFILQNPVESLDTPTNPAPTLSEELENAKRSFARKYASDFEKNFPRAIEYNAVSAPTYGYSEGTILGPHGWTGRIKVAHDAKVSTPFTRIVENHEAGHATGNMDENYIYNYLISKGIIDPTLAGTYLLDADRGEISAHLSELPDFLGFKGYENGQYIGHPFGKTTITPTDVYTYNAWMHKNGFKKTIWDAIYPGKMREFIKFMNEHPFILTLPVAGIGLGAKTLKEKQGGKIKSIFKAQNGTFKDFWDSLPINQKDSTDFNVHRYWELWGKPKTFNEALEKGAYKLENDGTYHAFSGAWNENGEYEFTKSPQHPTIKYELDWFNSDDAKDFRSKYQLDSTSTPWKYKPINPQQ